MKCKSEFDGYRCQLPNRHKGKHANYGTDENPCFVQWTDEGAKAVERELQKVSAAHILIGSLTWASYWT
jgi:hypothetical protein